VFKLVFEPACVESDTLGCSACVVSHIKTRNSAWSIEKPIISFMLGGDHKVVV